MAIDRLNQGTPAAASQIPFYDPTNGQDRRASLSAFATAIQALLSPQGGYVTQYAAPNASAFNIAIAPPTDGASVFLLLTPTGAFAAGTITLPLQASCIDGQEVLVTCTQIVTALTVAGNGSVVNGAPTTLAAANAFFRLRFDGVARAWYRVG